MTGDPVAWTMIEPGWKVVATDGDDVGRVDEVVADESVDIFNGLEIVTGALGSRKYVPAEQVDEIVEGEVRLALSADEVHALP